MAKNLEKKERKIVRKRNTFVSPKKLQIIFSQCLFGPFHPEGCLFVLESATERIVRFRGIFLRCDREAQTKKNRKSKREKRDRRSTRQDPRGFFANSQTTPTAIDRFRRDDTSRPAALIRKMRAKRCSKFSKCWVSIVDPKDFVIIFFENSGPKLNRPEFELTD